MREFLKSSGRRLSTGWFWPLVLLALPNCVLGNSGLPNPNKFNPGGEPLSTAVMCDIAKVPDPGNPGSCANLAESGSGMSLAHAAVALAQGEFNSLGLDFTPAATNSCNGSPRKTEFFEKFPDGSVVCLNCAQMIPAVYADGNAVCVAKCKELVGVGEVQPPGGLDAYCQANAHVSTNFDKTACYPDVCSVGGTPGAFEDPRRTQEKVKWSDFFGTTAVDNTLTRLAVTTGDTPADFNAGAAANLSQNITVGDAWIEFEVLDNTKSHALGVHTTNGGIDTNPSLTDMLFALDLNKDGNIYFLEHGNQVGPTAGAYTAGQRFRIHITDNNDGTAKITYGRLNGSCTPGTKCLEDPLVNQQTSPDPAYPLRVDASLREQDAQLKDVTMVRIITQ